MIRQRVLYSGAVQGVYFRATASELARAEGLTGYVRNLPNGDVELEAQGPSAGVEQFRSKLRERYRGHICDEREQSIQVQPDETGFEIRR